MNKSKKKIKLQEYIGFLFLILIGAISGFVMVMYLDRYAEDLPLYKQLLSLLALFIGMYAASFIHMILHEAGHLVFGLMTGYKFNSFRIASFMWIRENGKLRLKRHSLAGTGGQCLMTPPDIKDGKFPLVLYNLGGSIVNAVIGALFLLGYFLVPSSPIISAVFMIFAVVGFISAATNGIPMRMGTIDNDGYNAFSASRSNEAAEALWLQLKVVEQNSRGIRLKDMPAEWFTVPTDEEMKNSMVAVRGVFAANRLMDEERFEEADALMEHLLDIESGIVGLHRDLLVCDRIYIELIRENRREKILDMLTKEQHKFMKSMKCYPSVLRTQYAIAAIYEKDMAKAESISYEFEKISKTYPYPQEIEAERALMNIINNMM